MSSENVITSLFATLGFKVNTQGLEDFKKGLTETSKNILTVRNVLKSLTFAGIVAMSRAVSQVVADLDNLNKTTGLSIDLIQDWQLVAEKFNVNKQSITNAFSQIAKARADILQGKGNATAWYMLGIDPTEDPETVFNNVLKMVNQIKDPALRSQKLINLGLDANLVNLIGKTRKDYIDYYTTLKPLNDKERKQILDLKNSFNSLKISLSLLKDNFIFIVSPIKNFIELCSRIIHIIGTAINWLAQFKIGLIAIQTAIAGIGVWLAPFTLKIKLIMGLIVALMYVVEDLWVGFQGGESVIFNLVHKIVDWVKWLWQKITDLTPDWFKKLLSGTNKFFQGVIKFFADLVGAGKGIIEERKQKERNAEYIKNKQAQNPLRQLANQTQTTIQDNLGNVIKPTWELSQSPYLQQKANEFNDNRNITNNYNVNGNDTQKIQETIIKTQESLNINETFNHMGR